MKVYDPREGEDFTFSGRPVDCTFSSVRHGLYVMDEFDSTMSEAFFELLKHCIPNTSSIGFFTLLPWSPGAKKLKDRIVRQFENVTEDNGSLVGYFPIARLDTIAALINIRAEYGSNVTGEWGFGGCMTRFSDIRRPDAEALEWSFDRILSYADNLRCLLYLGDVYRTFMTQPFDGFDDIRHAVLEKRG